MNKNILTLLLMIAGLFVLIITKISYDVVSIETTYIGIIVSFCLVICSGRCGR